LKRLTKTVSLLEEHDYVDEKQLAWWKNFLKEETEFTISKVVPTQYTADSEFKMKFPKRSDGDVAVARAEVERSAPRVELTEADRRSFGKVQVKEAYIGKRMSRTRRNDRAADAELELTVDSFVMLRNNDKEEPLLFGKVTSIDREKKQFDLWYYGRADQSGYSITGRFTPIWVGLPGKGQKSSKWIGTANFDTILNFDINLTKATGKGKAVSITKKGQASCLAAIENCRNFRGDETGDKSKDDDENEEDDVGSSDSEDANECNFEDAGGSDDFQVDD